ncbi:pSer/pThr/pTyr-binding forkhead associated (FHA) protein [Agromyces terreus]|uniref:PSer/pThr/pTyr-binding forkhead associated (FHA) protein n=1 Tax=Agromyces terreus TaxID=424795 RepID=A0A9X2KBJ0_9MICO|nr:FHA domain-containing protein [Agromyces terreus]MCP2371438.1 pSer/pThr/pTyr-binding forkhead associated (FHA) protein [Agromyces terreus]
MVHGTVTSASRAGRAPWDVVVGDRFIAALAAPADDRALSALAEAACDPRVGIERLVQAVPAPPAEPDRGFAIVWWSDGDDATVTAVVRGAAIVDLESPGGSRRFDARGIRPWHLAEFRDVTGVRLAGADAPLERLSTAGERVRHARASLRASEVEWSPVATTNAASERSDAAEPGQADEDTVLRGPVPRAGQGAADVAPAEAARRPSPMVRIGRGDPRAVGAPILIGRRPHAPRTPFAPAGIPELVAVRSPTGVISGTHLELRVEGSKLVATDLRSTNGTVLRTPGGERRLRSGESVVVAEGSLLDLGDDTIVEVLPAREDDTSPSRDDRPSP